MARVTAKVRGAAAAQAMFDVLHGRAVCWTAQSGGWHRLDFDHEGIEQARAHLADLFPNDTFSVGRWIL